MNSQRKNHFILKASIISLISPNITAFPVKIYSCPVTNNTLVEQILSVSKEDLNKPITDNTKLEFSKKFKYQSALKDSPEFEIYKSAITEIRKKVFKQLDESEAAGKLKVNKIKNSLVNIGNKNKTSPKTFSYAKLLFESSNINSYELYSISGEFQILNDIGSNKIFANYDESGNQKLNYFAPPEKDYENMLLKDIDTKKSQLKRITSEVDKFEKLAKENTKKQEIFLEKAKKSREDANKLTKELDDLNFQSEENLIKKEIEKIHQKTVAPDSLGRIRDSDSEALILERVLTLTSPNQTTQAFNNFYSTLYDSLHSYWNLDKKFPKDIVNIKLYKSLNVNDLNQHAVGTLKLYTSYETCPSCKNAYLLFSALRPNIKLEITTVSNELRNYLYTNDFSEQN